jgi:hypothetical protein
MNNTLIINSNTISTEPSTSIKTPICTDQPTFSCGNTKDLGEFTSLPYVFITNKDYGGNLYLKYYQHIVGVNNPNKPKITGLIVEPVGNTCKELKTGPGGLDNFWRSITNVSCDDAFLSISQASPIRYCTFNNLTLCNGCRVEGCYSCDNCGDKCACDYTSGGFIADSNMTVMEFASQQQYLAKNCSFVNVQGGSWCITLLNCTYENITKGYNSCSI